MRLMENPEAIELHWLKGIGNTRGSRQGPPQYPNLLTSNSEIPEHIQIA